MFYGRLVNVPSGILLLHKVSARTISPCKNITSLHTCCFLSGYVHNLRSCLQRDTGNIPSGTTIIPNENIIVSSVRRLHISVVTRDGSNSDRGSGKDNANTTTDGKDSSCNSNTSGNDPLEKKNLNFAIN